MPMQYGAYGIKCTTANCCDLETQIESAPLLSGGLSSCGPHDNAQFRREQNWLDIIGVSGEATGTGAVVAIIDNGIAPTHPDLVGRVSTTRKDTNGQTYAQAALQPQPEWQGWPNEYLDVATSRHGKERVYRSFCLPSLPSGPWSFFASAARVRKCRGKGCRFCRSRRNSSAHPE